MLETISTLSTLGTGMSALQLAVLAYVAFEVRRTRGDLQTHIEQDRKIHLQIAHSLGKLGAPPIGD